MIYLVLAVAGTVLPVWFNLSVLVRTDWATLLQITDWRAYADSYYLTIHWDLIIASLAIIVWVSAEVAVRRNWVALIAIPATVLIGISSGLPLYLFLRTRPLA